MQARRCLLTTTAAVALAASSAQAQETIELEAWTIGPDEPSVARSTNLERAADKLNDQLAADDAGYRVELTSEFDTTGWDSYRRRVLLSFESGDAPDIVQSAHVDTAAWADAGFLRPVDDYRQEHDAFADIVDGLWPAVTYKGETWGIPQDTEARPLYFNRDLLAELGWSPAEINALPWRIREGDYTWADMMDTAERAVEEGVVEAGNGYWHRPANGPDFFQYLMLYGAQLQDPETGNLVYDMSAAEDAFAMLAEMVERDIFSPEVNGLSWDTFHNETAANSNVLFWSGGTWNWAEYKESYVADRGAAYLRDTIGFALQPQAHPDVGPVTLSQPQAYMVNANTDHPDVVGELLAALQDPEIERNHFLRTLRPPVLEASRELDAFQDNWFISRIAYMPEYSDYQPVHPSLGQYLSSYYRVLTAVEAGEFGPGEGAQILAEELRRNLGEDVAIRE